MTPKPQFRQIATADVSAAELDRLSDRMNVPKIIQPAQQTAEMPRQSNAELSRQRETAQPRAEKRPKASPQQRLTIRIPATLNKIMKRHALEQETTVRAIILKALQKAGYEVSDADLAPGAGGNW